MGRFDPSRRVQGSKQTAAKISQVNNKTKTHMPTKLKAKDPKSAEPSKPKMLISGPPGVGKTWFATAFPSVYLIDTEGGANLNHYTDRLKASGGVYMGPEDGTLDPDIIIEQFAALATEKHNYKTVVIDSVTKLFNHLIAKEQERLGDKDAFGASKKPAVAFMRRLIMWTDRLDMSVLFIAHETPEWGVDATGQRTQIGVTADVWNKLAYELHLWLHCTKRGPQREAIVRKSRLVGFPDQDRLALDFTTFAERYGKDVIEKKATQIALATPEQVAEIKSLLDSIKVDEETVSKWWTKASVDRWEDMTAEQIAKCIQFLKAKIK